MVSGILDKSPGDMIRQGEVLGVVKDYEGTVLEVCRAEYDGVVLYQTGSLQVKESGPMIAYGKISREADNRKEKNCRILDKAQYQFSGTETCGTAQQSGGPVVKGNREIPAQEKTENSGCGLRLRLLYHFTGTAGA